MVQAEPSDIPIEGNASAIDEETDAKIAAQIKRQLAKGNAWAWCDVRVRVTYRNTIERDAILGGCSYKDERSFRRDNGTFRDMVGDCLDQINKALVVLCAPDEDSSPGRQKGAKSNG
jgi:hypothetical protein